MTGFCQPVYSNAAVSRGTSQEGTREVNDGTLKNVVSIQAHNVVEESVDGRVLHTNVWSPNFFEFVAMNSI